MLQGKKEFVKAPKLPQAQSAEEIEAREKLHEAKEKARAGRTCTHFCADTGESLDARAAGRVDCDDKPKKKKGADDDSDDDDDEEAVPGAAGPSGTSGDDY